MDLRDLKALQLLYPECSEGTTTSVRAWGSLKTVETIGRVYITCLEFKNSSYGQLADKQYQPITRLFCMCSGGSVLRASIEDLEVLYEK